GVSMTSQELRLVSPSDQPFRWITGAYFIHTNRSLLTRGFFDVNHSPSQFDNPALLLIQKSESNSNDAWALYGQADYDLTSHLTLSGALRYDNDHRHQLDAGSGLVRSATFDDTEPKVTATYHFDPDRLVYATYSTGFRSGGFNAPGVSIPEFKAETLTNYEAGFKTSWMNRKLILNGAIYYADDHNFQFFFVDALTASQIIGNLDKVHIWGVELEARAMVADGLQLFGGLGTTDTDIRQSTAFAGIVGNKTPKTVPWTLNLGFQYDRSLGDDLNGTVHFEYQHHDKKYWQIDNLAVQDPVELINARAGVEYGNWGFYIWGRNLTDAQYYEDYNPGKFSGLPYDIGSLVQPRTYGVEARVSF
ncbi:MAG: TonB-dependent receptor, partial [Pseudomonadota bacterium]|nr:TonB-dependent receptor [Pseudomonadota bacterium]